MQIKSVDLQKKLQQNNYRSNAISNRKIMKNFIIINGQTAYLRKFEYSSDAKTWAIAHCDCSDDITIREIKTINLL